MSQNLFAMLPKVDEWLDQNQLENINAFPRSIVLRALRMELEVLREKIRAGISEEELSERIRCLSETVFESVKRLYDFRFKRLINATGVIVHTNLGRSLIGVKANEHVANISSHYSNLEYDLDHGVRGSRYSHLTQVISDITGAEDAMVVNNNAAAVMLVLSTLAKGREVVVSRGEMIEIGGAFRIPDVMESSGAILHSIGTTNKTHLWDYENAIGENTAALMKIHTSNYRIMGFTESVSAEQLVAIRDRYQIPVIEDLGSGVLIDLSEYGLEKEPTVQDSVRAGVDLVTFSGDKLLGGTQAGIIVGKKQYIDRLKKNPLTRALRVDKYTIACLEAVFREYYDKDKAVSNIPTLRMLTEPSSSVGKRAHSLLEMLHRKQGAEKMVFSVVPSDSEVGGGAMPLEKIPTYCVTVSLKEVPLNQYEHALRHLEVPVIGRITEDQLYLDMRTVQPDESELLVEGIFNAYHHVEMVKQKGLLA